MSVSGVGSPAAAAALVRRRASVSMRVVASSSAARRGTACCDRSWPSWTERTASSSSSMSSATPSRPRSEARACTGLDARLPWIQPAPSSTRRPDASEEECSRPPIRPDASSTSTERPAAARAAAAERPATPAPTTIASQQALEGPASARRASWGTALSATTLTMRTASWSRYSVRSPCVGSSVPAGCPAHDALLSTS